MKSKKNSTNKTHDSFGTRFGNFITRLSVLFACIGATTAGIQYMIDRKPAPVAGTTNYSKRLDLFVADKSKFGKSRYAIDGSDQIVCKVLNERTNSTAYYVVSIPSGIHYNSSQPTLRGDSPIIADTSLPYSFKTSYSTTITTTKMGKNRFKIETPHSILMIRDVHFRYALLSKTKHIYCTWFNGKRFSYEGDQYKALINSNEMRLKSKINYQKKSPYKLATSIVKKNLEDDSEALHSQKHCFKVNHVSFKKLFM